MTYPLNHASIVDGWTCQHKVMKNRAHAVKLKNISRGKNMSGPWNHHLLFKGSVQSIHLPRRDGILVATLEFCDLDAGREMSISPSLLKHLPLKKNNGVKPSCVRFSEARYFRFNWCWCFFGLFPHTYHTSLNLFIQKSLVFLPRLSHGIFFPLCHP